ncbi:MAG: hypothetical protein H8E25_07205 [Planctomycetes bacterium]|nr:hypothetical protein [Planctomycetota bacterium]
MRTLLLLLILPAITSCQSSPLEAGDSYFRQKSFLQAYHEYIKLDSAVVDVQQRISITRYFLAEESVRSLSNSGNPEEALELLNQIKSSAPADRSEMIKSLEARCRNHIAVRHFETALELNDIGNKKGAIRELLIALSWRKEYLHASQRLSMIGEREEMRNLQGEENYLEAIGHLENGDDVRARTSFMHASNLLTDPDLAIIRLNAISQTLAEDAMRQAQIYLDARQTGMAWVAIQDAIHLGIEDPKALEIAARLNSILLSQAHLVSADVRVRAGNHQLASDSLASAAGYSVVEHAEEIIELRNLNQEGHQQHLYLQARSYELDTQLQRANELYQQIFKSSNGFGYKDTEARLKNTSKRLSEAKLYYQQALAANENNDQESYAENLRSVLTISIDFEDALFLFGQQNNVRVN